MKNSNYINSRQTDQGVPTNGAAKKPAGMTAAMNTAVPVNRKLGKAVDTYPTCNQPVKRVR